MGKDTSPEVASLAAKVLSGDHKPTDAEMKTIAASALSQREDTSDATGAYERLEDSTAFSQFIFDNLQLVMVPSPASAFNLAQAIQKHLKGEA